MELDSLIPAAEAHCARPLKVIHGICLVRIAGSRTGSPPLIGRMAISVTSARTVRKEAMATEKKMREVAELISQAAKMMRGETPHKIVIRQTRPPIPTRSFDWVAFRKGNEESGPFFWGKTEKEAVAELLEYESENY